MNYHVLIVKEENTADPPFAHHSVLHRLLQQGWEPLRETALSDGRVCLVLCRPKNNPNAPKKDTPYEQVAE